MTKQDNLVGSWLCCKLKIHFLLLSFFSLIFIL
jgi:hypothetical protein